MLKVRHRERLLRAGQVLKHRYSYVSIFIPHNSVDSVAVGFFGGCRQVLKSFHVVFGVLISPRNQRSHVEICKQKSVIVLAVVLFRPSFGEPLTILVISKLP